MPPSATSVLRQPQGHAAAVRLSPAPPTILDTAGPIAPRSSRSAKPSRRENLLLSTTLRKAPHYSIRITVRTIIIVIGVLVAAMWAAVGLSVITSRQAAVDAAS